MLSLGAVPVTDIILSSSALSPTLTVTPSTILAAVIPLVVTALIVWLPPKYCPDVIVWSEDEVLYVVAALDWIEPVTNAPWTYAYLPYKTSPATASAYFSDFVLSHVVH